MINIKLSPVVSNERPKLINWESPVLTIGVETFDLSELPDGATAQHPTLGKVERSGDDYECTVILYHPSQHKNAEGVCASYEQRFPDPVIMQTNGNVPLPQPEVKTNELA